MRLMTGTMSSLPTTVGLHGTCCADATKGRQTITRAAALQKGRSMLRSLACSESDRQIDFGYRWMTIELITTGLLLKACIVGNPEVIRKRASRIQSMMPRSRLRDNVVGVRLKTCRVTSVPVVQAEWLAALDSRHESKLHCLRSTWIC
jgi:hypothetical protein